jgi:hypothetical protein
LFELSGMWGLHGDSNLFHVQHTRQIFSSQCSKSDIRITEKFSSCDKMNAYDVYAPPWRGVLSYSK